MTAHTNTQRNVLFGQIVCFCFSNIFFRFKSCEYCCEYYPRNVLFLDFNFRLLYSQTYTFKISVRILPFGFCFVQTSHSHAHCTYLFKAVNCFLFDFIYVLRLCFVCLTFVSFRNFNGDKRRIDTHRSDWDYFWW